MAGAPKGNKNALKHGLYASKAEIVTVADQKLREPSFAIKYLEEAVEEIFNRMMNANGEEFTRLANALSFATTALFNGHRTMAFLTGGMNPIEDAIKELEALNFDED